MNQREEIDANRWRIGIDIGGTFTDLIALDRHGNIRTAKVLSTPDDFSRGILDGLRLLTDTLAAFPHQVERLFHATTVATNAILEDKGAKTALITTRGFRDVLELRRIRIPELYNFFLDIPKPMVPRRLRFEVEERLNALGEVLRPLEDAEISRVLDDVAAEGVEAVAICLLHAYANPVHEQRIAEAANQRLADGVYVSTSSDLVPEIREYERTSTTVINAAVGPIVRRYLTGLTQRLRQAGVSAPLEIMMSNGGLMAVNTAMSRPAAIVESGPAAGVIAAAHLARKCDLANVITLDMGGTTAKAGIIEDGAVARTSEYEVGAGINISSQLVKGRGHALKLPVIDLSEIGAGGGSIARIDASGMLTVGPHSAGADPGPACYGRGGSEPTLADAMVVLGYLNPTSIAGGSIDINAGLARDAVGAIANRLGKSTEETAHGIYLLAGAAMTRAVKAISTFRGRDPRDFHLVAFGGNGPLMAAQIADDLLMRTIVIPHNAGLFSAFGLLVGNAEHEFSQALVRRESQLRPEELQETLSALENKTATLFEAEGRRPDRLTIRRFADLRYFGQAYELTVEVPPGPVDSEGLAAIVTSFHREHERTYGHCAEAEPVDFVSLRVQASVPAAEGVAYGASAPAEQSRPAGCQAERQVYFGPNRGTLTAPVLGRRQLADRPRPGPLLIEEPDSTCLVPPAWAASLDRLGNIVLERQP